jgi:hypothetical protein
MTPGITSPWFGGSQRERERTETRRLWQETETLWRASPLASTEISDVVLTFIADTARSIQRVPAIPVLVEFCAATASLLDAEDITAIEVEWPVIDHDPAAALDFRQMLSRRRRWAADAAGMLRIFSRCLGPAYLDLFARLPETCFGVWPEKEEAEAFNVPLVELLTEPAEAIGHLVLFSYDDDTLRLDIFLRYRERLARNLLIASGFSPTDNIHDRSDRLISPTAQRGNGRTEFAVWLKHLTPSAIRLAAPLGFLEGQPLATEEAFAALLKANRDRYCGTLADVAGFPVSRPFVVDDTPSAPPSPRRAPATDTPETPDNESEVTRPLPREMQSAKPPPAPRRELGKGGSQHRYVQHLVKSLAEERGFRAVVEEAVEGGQVDVGLHRDDLTIACEISVTSTAGYELRNLAKCLQGGFAWVFAIADSAKRLRAIETLARAQLPAEDLARIAFLLPEQMTAALDAFIAPAPEESVVRGYKVKVLRTVVGVDEARERRAAITRVIANSMRGLPGKE